MRTYVHFGTGNYHPITARIYTDLSFFTCDPALARDAARLFNFMTGYARPEELEKIALSPDQPASSACSSQIDEEIEHAKAGRPGADLGQDELAGRSRASSTRSTRASQAGVQIDLVVRGICCLRPGVPGLSENIRVKSIVGRFLEHSRIVCFGDGHGAAVARAPRSSSRSADWMPRNLRPPRRDAGARSRTRRCTSRSSTRSWSPTSRTTSRAGTAAPMARSRRIAPGPDEEPFNAHDYFMNNPSLSGRGSSQAGNVPPEIIERSKKKAKAKT